MNKFDLVYPMFALVMLSTIVLVKLFRSRVSAVKEGHVSSAYFRIYQGEREPEKTAKASRQFSNLFEAPTLYYAACVTAMVVNDVSPWLLMMAWLYVVARVAHAYVHLGKNRLRHRIRAYFASWIVLVGMWLHIVVYTAAAHP